MVKVAMPLVRADDIEVLEQIISAMIAAQIVTVNTLHGQGIVDRAHFAHAYARVIEQLGEPSQKDRSPNRLLVAILTILKNSLVASKGSAASDTAEWLRAALRSNQAGADDESVN